MIFFGFVRAQIQFDKECQRVTPSSCLLAQDENKDQCLSKLFNNKERSSEQGDGKSHHF